MHEFTLENTISLEDAANRLSVSKNRLRRMLEEKSLAGVPVGDQWRIPEDFLKGDEPVAALRGTLILLEDLGLDAQERVEWLFGFNDDLGDVPISSLRAGHKAPVRRAAQFL